MLLTEAADVDSAVEGVVDAAWSDRSPVSPPRGCPLTPEGRACPSADLGAPCLCAAFSPWCPRAVCTMACRAHRLRSPISLPAPRSFGAGLALAPEDPSLLWVFLSLVSQPLS